MDAGEDGAGGCPGVHSLAMTWAGGAGCARAGDSLGQEPGVRVRRVRTRAGAVWPRAVWRWRLPCAPARGANHLAGGPRRAAENGVPRLTDGAPGAPTPAPRATAGWGGARAERGARGGHPEARGWFPCSPQGQDEHRTG